MPRRNVRIQIAAAPITSRLAEAADGIFDAGKDAAPVFKGSDASLILLLAVAFIRALEFVELF
jgi:hypothetical protein